MYSSWIGSLKAALKAAVGAYTYSFSYTALMKDTVITCNLVLLGKRVYRLLILWIHIFAMHALVGNCCLYVIILSKIFRLEILPRSNYHVSSIKECVNYVDRICRIFLKLLLGCSDKMNRDGIWNTQITMHQFKLISVTDRRIIKSSCWRKYNGWEYDGHLQFGTVGWRVLCNSKLWIHIRYVHFG